jgi:hypothetical protein
LFAIAFAGARLRLGKQCSSSIRIAGLPVAEKIAGPISFGSLSSYVSGATIAVTGGKPIL